MKIDDYFQKYFQLLKDEEKSLLLHHPYEPIRFDVVQAPDYKKELLKSWQEIQKLTSEAVMQIESYKDSSLISKYSNLIRLSIDNVKNLLKHLSLDLDIRSIIDDINSQWVIFLQYLPENEIKKSYKGIAKIMIKAGYFDNVSDAELVNIIEKGKLLEEKKPILWTGKPAHIFDFCNLFNILPSAGIKCFGLPNDKKLRYSNRTKARKPDFKSKIEELLKEFE